MTKTIIDVNKPDERYSVKLDGVPFTDERLNELMAEMLKNWEGVKSSNNKIIAGILAEVICEHD